MSTEQRSEAPCVSEEVFRAAIELVQNMPKEGEVSISYLEKLRFYALFKQATLGPCSTARPAIWNVVERYKWDAWASLGALDPKTARTKYVMELREVMRGVFESHTVEEFMADPQWQHLRPTVEPLFEVLGPVLGFKTASDVFADDHKGGRGEREESAKSASEDEYLDARTEWRSSNTPPDPAGADLASELAASFHSTSRLLQAHLNALSAAVQQQNQLLTSYLDKLLSRRALSWPLLLLLLLWPVLVQLALHFFLRRWRGH